MVSGKNGFEFYHGWDREAAIREICSCTDIDLVSSSSLGTVICNTRIKNNADKIFSYLSLVLSKNIYNIDVFYFYSVTTFYYTCFGKYEKNM